jgi:hypothetical protein
VDVLSTILVLSHHVTIFNFIHVVQRKFHLCSVFGLYIFVVINTLMDNVHNLSFDCWLVIIFALKKMQH